MINLPQDFDSLCEEISATKITQVVKGSRGDMLKRCIGVYFNARHSESAQRAGLIGVGLLTYADSRLATFSRRVARLAK